MSSGTPLAIPLGEQAILAEAASTLAQRVGLFLFAAVLFVNDGNFSNAESADAGLDGQTLLKIAICAGCGLFGGIYLLRSRQMIIQANTIWMIVFGCWSLLCVPAALSPIYSLVAVGLLWCMILFAPALIQTLGQRKVLLSALVILEVYLVACWIAHAVAPDLNGFDPDTSHAADAARLGGLSHPNNTASKAVLALGLILTLLNGRMLTWRRAILPLLFALVTLLLTGSRTWAIASVMLVSFAVWQWLTFQFRALLICGGITLLAVAALLSVNSLDGRAMEKVSATFSRSGDAEEIYSMTGRSDLWQFCRERIAESPVWGCGYGCQKTALEDHYWVTRHAHNLVLNTTLGGGYIGGAILILMLVGQAIRVFKTKEFFPAIILLIVIVGGISENPIFNPMPGAIMLMFMVSLFGNFQVDPRSTPSAGEHKRDQPAELNSAPENLMVAGK